MPDQAPSAVHPILARFAGQLALRRCIVDPANLLLIPVLCGCLAVVTSEVNIRLAGVLSVAALLMITTRMRHAVSVGTLLLCAFAAATLLYVQNITTLSTRPSVAASGHLQASPRHRGDHAARRRDV